MHYRIRIDRPGLDNQTEEHIQTRLRERRVKIDLTEKGSTTIGKLLSGYTHQPRKASGVSGPKANTPLPLKRSHVNFLHLLGVRMLWAYRSTIFPFWQ